MWNPTRTLGLLVCVEYTCDIRVYQEDMQGLKLILGEPKGSPFCCFMKLIYFIDIFL